LLGTNIPATSQGNVLTDMLTLTSEQNAVIQSALTKQQSTLIGMYAKAIGQPLQAAAGDLSVAKAQSMLEAAKTSRVNDERIPRFIGVGLLLGLILYFILKNWSASLVWIRPASTLADGTSELRSTRTGAATRCVARMARLRSNGSGRRGNKPRNPKPHRLLLWGLGVPLAPSKCRCGWPPWVQ